MDKFVIMDAMRTKDELIALLKSLPPDHAAEKIGVTRRSIDRYRSGKVSPSFDTLLRIDAAFPAPKQRKPAKVAA